MFLSEITQGTGLYDPGFNASIISEATLKKFKIDKFVPIKSTFNTVNGQGYIKGIIILPLTIFKIKKEVILFVLDSEYCSHDFIIGLDIIPFFKLSLDYNLCLTQEFEQKSYEIPNILSKGTSSNRVDINWQEFMSYELLDFKLEHLDNSKRKNIQDLIIHNSKIFAIAQQCIQQYNSSIHSVTSFSPSYLLTGNPTDLLPVSLRDPPDLVADRKLAFEKSLQYHNYNKKLYDKLKNEMATWYLLIMAIS